MPPSTQLRRAVSDQPHASDHNRLADSFLGIVGARHLRVGYDGVAKNPQGGAVLSTGNYSDTLQNTAGNHLAILLAATTPTAAPTIANSAMLVQDAGVLLAVQLELKTGKKLLFWNAGNTNSANLYHSGTNDVLKTDDGLQVSVALNVGGAVTAVTAGDASIQRALNVGTSLVAAAAGEASVQAALNVGASRLATTAGDVSVQHALNVGGAVSATDTGDGYMSGGLSLGTYANPGTGQLLATGLIQSSSTVQGTQLISTIATGTAPLSVTSTTVVPNLNVSFLEGLGKSGYIATPLEALASSALTLATGAPADLLGATVTLPSLGWWLILGTFDVDADGTGGDNGAVLQGYLNAAAGAAISNATSPLFQIPSAIDYRLNLMGRWLVHVTSGTPIVKLQGNKSGGTGVSHFFGGFDTSSISATFLGNS